jgi:hypothetical protein
MPASVRLPPTHWPSYPNLCIHCGAPGPGDLFDPVSEWIFKPSSKSASGDPTTAFRPVCTGCKRFLRAELWIRRAALLLLAVGLIYAIYHQYNSNHNGWGYTDYAYSVCGIGIWTLAWYLLRPPVRITNSRSKLRYTFRNKAVGRAFASINLPRR